MLATTCRKKETCRGINFHNLGAEALTLTETASLLESLGWKRLAGSQACSQSAPHSNHTFSRAVNCANQCRTCPHCSFFSFHTQASNLSQQSCTPAHLHFNILFLLQPNPKTRCSFDWKSMLIHVSSTELLFSSVPTTRSRIQLKA